MTAFLLFVFLLALYFLPGILASATNYRNKVVIWVANLLIGWLLIPWVIMLCMVLWKKEPKPQA